MYAIANEKYSERKSDHEFVILNNTANIFFKIGNYNKAIELWSYAARNVKDNSIIRRNLAIANYRNKELIQAVDHLNKAIDMSPGQADLYILKSEYLFGLERYEEAIQSLKIGIARGYDKQVARSVEAIILYHMKEYLAAEQIFRTSYSDSMTIEVLIWLLAIKLQVDDIDGIANIRNEVMRTASERDLAKWVNIMQEPGYHLSHNSRLISELKSILTSLGYKG
jgi:tetratricopeptide (TPR) repeat protein